MATEVLNIVLNASVKGDAAIRKMRGDLDDLGKSVQQAAERNKFSWDKTGTALIKFGAGIAGAAFAAKKAYDVIGEGAALLRAQDQFGRLTETVNSTADAMLGKLRDATSGMVSDADLMASASQIMSLGLQKTEDGVVRLASVAGQLGWDMNQVILTMANNSTMRLDALGLSIEDVDAKTKALIATGMSADEAFDLAVIQAGEEKVRLLGDAADTTAGKMAAFEASLANVGDAAKIAFAELAVEPINALAESLDKRSVVSDMESAFKSLNATQAEQYKMAVAVTGSYNLLWRDGFLPADEMAKRLNITIKLLADGFKGGTEELVALVNAQMAGNAVAEGSLSAYLNEAVAIEQVGAAAARTVPRLSQLIGTMGWWSQAQFDAGQAELAKKPNLTGPRGKFSRDVNQRYAYAAPTEIGRAASEAARLDRIVDSVGGGIGSWVNPLQESVEAMSQLSAESGDLFSRLRGAKEFNLAEELFSLGDKMGAGALDLAQFGVTAGLFDQARADELLGQSYMLQNAEQMLAQGMSLQEVWAAVQGQQANASALATEFFSTIDQTSAEATMLLETQQGYDALDAFVTAVETANPVMTVTANFPSIPGGPAPEPRAIGGPVYGGEPYYVGERGTELFVPSTNGRIIPNNQLGGGGHTFNFYNRESTALAMTSLGLARRAGLDRRMGVA